MKLFSVLNSIFIILSLDVILSIAKLLFKSFGWVALSRGLHRSLAPDMFPVRIPERAKNLKIFGHGYRRHEGKKR